MKAPFPYFGGKGRVAPIVWAALGQPKHFLEPFFGSGAVLLARPDFDPTAHVETICDKDGFIANVWRALQSSPDAVAKVCDWPVNHADLNARRKVLVGREAGLLEKLCADDKYFDVELAGYWIWAASCWIGKGLTSPNARPHIGDAGMGVHQSGNIPHISNAGRGVHQSGNIPHLSDAGKGVHQSGNIPHLSDAGMGVQDPYKTSLYSWFRELSERLRYVRLVCGDWSRVCGGNWQTKSGVCGMFFDPPYGANAGRDNNIYHQESLTVADDVREWCLARGDDPKMRIVLAGYLEEHESLLDSGWTAHRWSASGGYGNTKRKADSTAKGSTNRHNEALFFSPHCLRPATSEEWWG